MPLVIVSEIAFVNYQHSLEAVRLSQVQNLARNKVDKIESYFSTLHTELEMSQGFYNVRKNLPVLARTALGSKSPDATAAKKTLDIQLSRMRSLLELSDIMLTDNKGTIVYVNNPQHLTKDYSLSLSTISPEAYKQGKSGVFFSDVFDNKIVDIKSEMLAVAPVSGLNNEPIGIIVFEINMPVLYKQIQDSTGLGRTDEVLVGKKIGNEVQFLHSLIFDTTIGPSKRITIGSAVALPIQKAVSGETGIGQSVDYRGKPVVAAWRPVPTPGWGLVAKIDCDEAFADIIRLKRIVVIVVVSVFALIAIITFFVSQSISLPIRKLTKGAEIIGQGNLDHRVGTKVKDEIGVLSRTFDAMTKKLKETTASRDELNKEIAERKIVEKALQNTAKDLTRSNKDLEQFAYVASHDLQEPLRAVAGFMGLLKKQYHATLNTEAAEYIDLSVEGAERMQTLIQDLLTYSRVGTKGGAFVPTNMMDAYENAMKNLQVALDETGTIVTCDNSMPTIIADETQMTQLLQNLIGNALKFHGEKTPQIHVGAQRENDSWIMSVRDNGIGIEPQYFERIFLIFQRLHTRTQFKGTGIGLAVCKKIVERHGGSMWVESTPGVGSTFYFSIPNKENLL